MRELPADREPFARSLLSWYRRHGRDLPWRRSPDPYKVWVSEVMLQQTTVASAAPYFERFIKSFPTVQALASSHDQDLLALWSGLGYYHRARNMLKAARIICSRHGGRIPADMDSLRALPGVGPYTAGAILSIGFNLPSPALDGNVTRVVARLGGIEGDPASAPVRQAIEDLATRLMPRGRASAFNQALMDLGASLCAPRRPSCSLCPASRWCRGRREGLVDAIPPIRKAVDPLRIRMAAIALRRGSRFMLVRRDSGSLMEGMWEFPLVLAASRRQVEEAARTFRAELVGEAGQVRHTITRHRMKITVYEARPAKGARGVSRRQGSFRTLSEPGARLTTTSTLTATRWAPLEQIALGRGPVGLTGTARKIARLLSHDPSRPAPPRTTEAT